MNYGSLCIDSRVSLPNKPPPLAITLTLTPAWVITIKRNYHPTIFSTLALVGSSSGVHYSLVSPSTSAASSG